MSRILLSCGVASALCLLLFTAPRSSQPELASLTGEAYAVTFSKNARILWLNEATYGDLHLHSVDEERAVFVDTSGRFLDANGARFDDENPYGYGEAILASRPRILGEDRFSVEIADLASLGRTEGTVWENPAQL